MLFFDKSLTLKSWVEILMDFMYKNLRKKTILSNDIFSSCINYNILLNFKAQPFYWLSEEFKI